MYAVLSKDEIFPEKRDELLKVAEGVPLLLKSQKGFKAAILFSDDDNNEYGSIIAFETKEDYETYLSGIPQENSDALMAMFKSGEEPQQYYVNYLILPD